MSNDTQSLKQDIAAKSKSLTRQKYFFAFIAGSLALQFFSLGVVVADGGSAALVITKMVFIVISLALGVAYFFVVTGSRAELAQLEQKKEDIKNSTRVESPANP